MVRFFIGIIFGVHNPLHKGVQNGHPSPTTHRIGGRLVSKMDTLMFHLMYPKNNPVYWSSNFQMCHLHFSYHRWSPNSQNYFGEFISYLWYVNYLSYTETNLWNVINKLKDVTPTPTRYISFKSFIYIFPIYYKK